MNLSNYFYKHFLSDILYMVLFGILSLFLGYIKFDIYGVEGGATDLREIPLLISVFYFLFFSEVHLLVLPMYMWKYCFSTIGHVGEKNKFLWLSEVGTKHKEFGEIYYRQVPFKISVDMVSHEI